MDFTLCVPCLLGLEAPIADELKRMDLSDVRAENGRVYFRGDAQYTENRLKLRIVIVAAYRTHYAVPVKVCLTVFVKNLKVGAEIIAGGGSPDNVLGPPFLCFGNVVHQFPNISSRPILPAIRALIISITSRRSNSSKVLFIIPISSA